uniref:Tachykinin precursor 3a n=1 Tax=Seriola lalandi dorsalis TaxID=1841481 RepID=A0A3B4WVL4_SERLL
MRRGLLLVTLFLIMKLRYSQCRCEEPGSRRSPSDTVGLDNLKRNILKRYSDLDYDSFVGLMGRRNAGESSFRLTTREMHDIFVGLMGRRNSEPGECGNLQESNTHCNFTMSLMLIIRTIYLSIVCSHR